MKKIYAVSVLGLILAPAQGLAADLDSYSLSGAPAPQVVQIGQGWYIRGDIGASLDQTPSLTFNANSLSAPPPAAVAPTYGAAAGKTDFVGGLGVGYRFTDYFRADATIDYRTGMGFASGTGGIVCPYQAVSLYTTNAAGVTTPIGYLYNPNETCNAAFQLTQRNYTGLANGYFDLPGYWGITPYVGAGLGVNIQNTSGNLTYTKTSDGTPYAADLSPSQGTPQLWLNQWGQLKTPQPPIAFAPQNWNRSYNNTKYSLAIALTGGIGIALTPQATLDLSYRYLDLGSNSYVVNSQTGATVSQRNTAQEVRIGIRYSPD